MCTHTPTSQGEGVGSLLISILNAVIGISAIFQLNSFYSRRQREFQSLFLQLQATSEIKVM